VGPRFALAAVIAGMVSLLIVPSLWAASTIWSGGETRTPTAGPRPNGDRGAATQFVRDAEPLLEYLQAHQGTATYLVASADRDVARYAILQTNEPVIAFGGFHGNEPVLSTARLASLVNDGAVRFFLLEESSRKSNTAAQWIIKNCQRLPKTAWQPRLASSDKEAKGIVNPLYDCSPGREEWTYPNAAVASSREVTGMAPDVLLLAAALVMLSLVPALTRQAIALPRIVVATYSGTILLIALLWLGWVLLTWSDPRW
jgi:hypothetical protein